VTRLPRIDQIFRAIQCFWMVFVMVAVVTLYLESKLSPPTRYHYQCVYGCSDSPTSNRGLDFKDDSWFDPNSWFNPSYSQSYSDIDRVMRDQWQIGDRIYRTKDLMGRRI
jgi:hypothetical protein